MLVMERGKNMQKDQHDTKSRGRPGMKLATVRVFSCEHPLKPRVT